MHGTVDGSSSNCYGHRPRALYQRTDPGRPNPYYQRGDAILNPGGPNQTGELERHTHSLAGEFKVSQLAVIPQVGHQERLLLNLVPSPVHQQEN